MKILFLFLVLFCSHIKADEENLRVAVLASSKQYDSSNYLLIPAFQRYGLLHEEIVWDAPDIDWQQFDAILIRSTWDYIENDKFKKFLQTLATIGQLKIPLYNSLATVLWNSKKTYLQQLSKNGVLVIDTIFTTRHKTPRIQSSLEQLGGNEWVIKPAVSAGANKTFRVTVETAQEMYQSNYDLDEEVMIQSFISEIVTCGEMSFVFFNGTFSHAVRQVPALGDFRVQHIHGATVKKFLPEQWMISETSRILDIAQKSIGEELPFLYARVDVIERNNRLYLMELELIEPTLHLDCQEGSADTFATALKTRFHLGSHNNSGSTAV
jgi:glutathione synthase/RimK-type ligase-like ATP-grasp enzyme